PNPLVTCLSLATLLAVLGGSPRGAAIAGVLGAIALATKIWYLPVCLATLLFLARRRRDLLAPYAVALGSSLVAVLFLGTASAGAVRRRTPGLRRGPRLRPRPARLLRASARSPHGRHRPPARPFGANRWFSAGRPDPRPATRVGAPHAARRTTALRHLRAYR